MKLNYIETNGYPTEEKNCLCMDSNGMYVVSYPYINSSGFVFWEHTEEMVNPDNIVAWVYIDDLNLS